MSFSVSFYFPIAFAALYFSSNSVSVWREEGGVVKQKTDRRGQGVVGGCKLAKMCIHTSWVTPYHYSYFDVKLSVLQSLFYRNQ